MSERPSNARRFDRAPVVLEVHYRTKGSFLVSYSLNLSKGGLFLETAELLPVGSLLTVRFSVPGTGVIETEASVMWVRQAVSEEGLPPGLGLQFAGLEERLGSMIDRLVQDFTGMRLLAVAGDGAGQDRLSRQLRSILSADVGVATATQLLIEGFGERADLVLIDLDSTGAEGIGAIHKASAASPSIPVVAMTRYPEQATQAIEAGAATVLENPPPYDLLRQRVLDVLGKPFRTA